MIAKMIAAATLACVAGAALAAGDMPVKLDRQQATAEYQRVRSLLANEGHVCPGGQVPVSGLVSGGSAPGNGSRTTTITFDKGAVVRIVRSWDGRDAAASAATFTVNCAGDPAMVSVSPAELMGERPMQDAADRCRQAEASLRVPPSGRCPPEAVAAGANIESDSEYLQHRAATLNERIDLAVTEHKLSRRKASDLRLVIGKVQTLAANLQARNGTIARGDADRMNQQLTDAERALPLQR